MADYSQELENLIQLYDANEYDKALEKAQVLLDKYPDNEKINRMCYLIFFAYGEKLKNSNLIDQGVELIERFKNISNRKSQLELHYSLANYAKTKLLTPGTQKDEILKIRSEQKQALQNSLLYTQKLNSKILSILKSDYAVSLGWSGRYVESFDYFHDSLELNPHNAIVISKLVISLLPLISITPKYNNIILFECWRLLNKATNNHDRVMITKEKVYSDYEPLLIVERLIALSFKRGLE
jgi:tetratricopeptide (TPR) repeat protein